MHISILVDYKHLEGKKTLNFVYPTEVSSKTHHQIATGNNFKLKHLLVQAYWQSVKMVVNGTLFFSNV